MSCVIKTIYTEVEGNLQNACTNTQCIIHNAAIHNAEICVHNAWMHNAQTSILHGVQYHLGGWWLGIHIIVCNWLFNWLTSGHFWGLLSCMFLSLAVSNCSNTSSKICRCSSSVSPVMKILSRCTAIFWDALQYTLHDMLEDNWCRWYPIGQLCSEITRYGYSSLCTSSTDH